MGFIEKAFFPSTSIHFWDFFAFERTAGFPRFWVWCSPQLLRAAQGGFTGISEFRIWSPVRAQGLKSGSAPARSWGCHPVSNGKHISPSIPAWFPLTWNAPEYGISYIWSNLRRYISSTYKEYKLRINPFTDSVRLWMLEVCNTWMKTVDDFACISFFFFFFFRFPPCSSEALQCTLHFEEDFTATYTTSGAICLIKAISAHCRTTLSLNELFLCIPMEHVGFG